jgi:hypothetical protein
VGQDDDPEVLNRRIQIRPFCFLYRDAHAVDCITEREKVLMGLAVAMMRRCDP